MSADDLRAEKRYNATELLDRLLHGYDRRLHPGFGGEKGDWWELWGERDELRRDGG